MHNLILFITHQGSNIGTWFEPQAFPFLLPFVGVLQEEGRVQAVLVRVRLKLDAEKED